MGEEKKKSDGGENSNNNVVLKVDCTCDGCASKIKHCLRSFPGVDNVKADTDTGKITVTGKVSDPAKMKKKLEEKLNKKVTLISPQLKKEKNNNNGDDKENNKTDANNNKKEKEKETPPPVVTTAVLKVALHCQGCVDKIRKTVSKTKGVTEMGIDKEKETVTVKGTMDVKALAANLMEKLKRKVEVVPPKKPDNKENNGGGGEGKKNKGGGGGGGNNNEEMAVMMEQNRMEYMGGQAVGYGYGYGGYGYGGPVMMHPHHHHGGYSSYVPVYTYPEQLHFHAPPPQIFSDENPHACSIM